MRYLTLTLLICCFTLSFMFSGVRPASSYTSDRVLSVPVISADSTDSLGTVLIKEEYAMSIRKGDCMSFTLPSYTELQKLNVYFPSSTSYLPSVAGATYGVDYLAQAPGDNVFLGSSGLVLEAEDKNRFTLRVDTDWGKTIKTFRSYIYFDEVRIKADAPAGEDLKITLEGTGGFSSNTLTVAKIAAGSGGAAATADSPRNTTDQGGRIATITISENTAGTLKNNTACCKEQDTVKLALSPGFTWDTVTLLAGWGYQTGDIDYTIDLDTSGYSVLYLQVNNETTSSTGKGRITILGNVTVDESIAQAGKVEVFYEGTNPGVSPAVLNVADYNVPGCSIKEKAATEVTAGHINQALGEFTVSEGMAGDLAEGRTITLTLPDGVKWRTFPTVRRESGNCTLGKPAPVGSDRQTIRYVVTGAGSEKSVLRFEYATVDLAVAAPAQIEISASGSGGAKGKAIAANTIIPVKLSAGKTDVFAGVQNQPAGEVTVSEEKPGALRARDASGSGAGAVLELKLPAGVTFSEGKLPQVEVTEGNLLLEKTNIRLDQENRTLIIPVHKSGTTAGTIKVSGFSLNLDRMVPEGDINLEVSGTALSETMDLFSNDLNKLEVTLAYCVTPAPTGKLTGAVFTIGSTSYEAGSKKQEMDVAPYIKDGRTYGPVRYIAYALGLSDKDIIWDEGTQTVTLMQEKRVVQFKVGKPGVFVQGTEIPIDVAPEIIEPGRVMLPYRWVGFALGASVSWDEESRQVLVCTI